MIFLMVYTGETKINDTYLLSQYWSEFIKRFLRNFSSIILLFLVTAADDHHELLNRINHRRRKV